jgi:hypothetical protein
MEQTLESVAIACTLSDAEFRERRTLARKTILPKIIEYQRIPNGLTLSFANSPTTRGYVENFIVLEQGCCSFLTFELTPEPVRSGETLVLTVTGPSGATAFIDTFVRILEAERDAPDAA